MFVFFAWKKGSYGVKNKKPFAPQLGRKASFRDTTQIDRFRPSSFHLDAMTRAGLMTAQGRCSSASSEVFFPQLPLPYFHRQRLS